MGKVKLESKKISVTKPIHDRLIEDRDYFTKTIGINFSFSDTINEYHKILDENKDE